MLTLENGCEDHTQLAVGHSQAHKGCSMGISCFPSLSHPNWDPKTSMPKLLDHIPDFFETVSNYTVDKELPFTGTRTTKDFYFLSPS